jgi:outer membrane protein assembly factor BamB
MRSTRHAFRVLAGASATVFLLLSGWLPAQASHPASSVDWPTWGYDVSRTGYNPNETTLTTSNVGGLQKLWTFTFPATTYNAPVVAADVLVNGTPTDLIYVGDNAGDLYALKADNASVVWQANLGVNNTPCFGPLGVTGSGVLDRSTNRIYAIGGDGMLYAFDLATGQVAAGWPVRITSTNRPNEFVWSSPNLSNGQLYVTVASGCDRNGPYYGRVVDINASTRGQSGIFWVTDGKNSKVSGGGIWGWGGAAVDPGNRSVYVATGNALHKPENYLYADQVVRLSHGLLVQAANYPGITGSDQDFGSTPILFDGPGSCGPQMAVDNKDGEIFIYNRDNIAAGPEDRVFINGEDLITVPAYSPVTGLIYAGHHLDSPDGMYPRGIIAFRIRPEDCKLEMVWQQPVGGGGAVSEPVVANGVVYYGDGKAHHLYAFDASTGAILWNSGKTISTWLDTEPVVVNGHLYVTSGSTLYSFGL